MLKKDARRCAKSHHLKEAGIRYNLRLPLALFKQENAVQAYDGPKGRSGRHKRQQPVARVGTGLLKQRGEIKQNV